MGSCEVRLPLHVCASAELAGTCMLSDPRIRRNCAVNTCRNKPGLVRCGGAMRIAHIYFFFLHEWWGSLVVVKGFERVGRPVDVKQC